MFARLALGDAGPQRIFQVAGPLHLEHPLFRAGEAACAGRRDWWVASSRFAEIEAGERSLLWIWTHRFTDWLRLKSWEWLP